MKSKRRTRGSKNVRKEKKVLSRAEGREMIHEDGWIVRRTGGGLQRTRKNTAELEGEMARLSRAEWRRLEMARKGIWRAMWA